MSSSTNLQLAKEIVEQLQEHLEDRDGLSMTLVANFTWNPYWLEIAIGDIAVYCSEIHDELSFEACKREWQSYLESLKPYYD